jgi:amino-acid N-acetyltransferase
MNLSDERRSKVRGDFNGRSRPSFRHPEFSLCHSPACKLASRLENSGVLTPLTPKSQFSEKSFYLEEFRGKALLFALIPPAGRRLSELSSLVKTLRELRRNQTPCLVAADRDATPMLLRRIGRLSSQLSPHIFTPAHRITRRRPYPADSALGELWLELSVTALAIISIESEEPTEFLHFVRALASRLRVFKAILLDRAGGLRQAHDQRISFLEMRRIGYLTRAAETAPMQRAVLRAIKYMLERDVGSVNLTTPNGVYEELFSYLGTGTLFTKARYGTARPISIDEFDQAHALIERGQSEGTLLARTRTEVARLLPTCVGYRLGEGQLAGICALLTEPYQRQRAGEITALYTLTRFQREGVASELVREVLNEACARRLKYVFACTSEPHAARLFERLGFQRVSPEEVAAAKWHGYDQARRARLLVFRHDL